MNWNTFTSQFLSNLSLMLARSPRWLQQLLRKFLFLLAYYLLSYRKKVVDQNLELAFPAWSAAKRKHTRKLFYQHLSETLLEINAIRNLSREAYRQKIHYENIEVLQNLLKEGKSVIIAYAHYGNWEYTTSLPLWIDEPVYAVYRTLSNPIADRVIFETRSRFGAIPVPMQHIYKELSMAQAAGKNHVALFVADQSPPRSQIKAWFPFLSQPTAFFQGVERISRKLGHAVVYLEMSKKPSGQYRGRFELITDNPKTCLPNEISLRYVRLLEATIQKEPARWLWSHRRWKHKPDGSIILTSSAHD